MLANYRQSLCVVMQLLVLMVGVAQTLAGQVQLTWDAPTDTDGTPITTITGYFLYYWQDSDGMSHRVDVGDQTTYTLSDLMDGRIYAFAVTAYDTDGNESRESHIVTMTMPSAVTLVSPPPQSMLPGPTVLFEWTDGGMAVTAWWVEVGSDAGANDLFDSGFLGREPSMTVHGLPTDGEPIFVRLWYVLDGTWQFSDFQYSTIPAL